MPRSAGGSRPPCGDGAIVTDVGSVKEAAIRDLRPLLPPGVQFVPGHPVAGTEHSGPESGFAELFRDRWCILTPPPETDARRGGEGHAGCGNRPACGS